MATQEDIEKLEQAYEDALRAYVNARREYYAAMEKYKIALKAEEEAHMVYYCALNEKGR